MKTITKLLSRNDVGSTDSHQAGIHVPKHGGFLEFFPIVDAAELNPSTLMLFSDQRGVQWTFRFIYYNNRLFGGTRDEYRLTRMTRFFRQYDAQPGDGLVLSRYKRMYYAEVIPAEKQLVGDTATADVSIESHKTITVEFGQNWKILTIKE